MIILLNLLIGWKINIITEYLIIALKYYIYYIVLYIMNNEFNLNDLCKPCNICIIDKNNFAQKIIKKIISHKNVNSDKSILVTSSENNKLYKKYIPSDNIYNDLNIETIYKLLDHKTDNLKYYIIDNSSGHKTNILNDSYITEPFMMCRTFKLINIVIVESKDKLRPELSCCFNYIIILKDDDILNRKIIYDNYFECIFYNFNEFNRYLDLYENNIIIFDICEIENERFRQFPMKDYIYSIEL